MVLHHATGRLAGLYQILGVVDAAAADYPPSLPYGLRGAQTARHTRTQARYIGYREWAQTSVGRLNEFSPAQR